MLKRNVCYLFSWLLTVQYLPPWAVSSAVYLRLQEKVGGDVVQVVPL